MMIEISCQSIDIDIWRKDMLVLACFQYRRKRLIIIRYTSDIVMLKRGHPATGAIFGRSFIFNPSKYSFRHMRRQYKNFRRFTWRCSVILCSITCGVKGVFTLVGTKLVEPHLLSSKSSPCYVVYKFLNAEPVRCFDKTSRR
jgi:hypothetical protein